MFLSLPDHTSTLLGHSAMTGPIRQVVGAPPLPSSGEPTISSTKTKEAPGILWTPSQYTNMSGPPHPFPKDSEQPSNSYPLWNFTNKPLPTSTPHSMKLCGEEHSCALVGVQCHGPPVLARETQQREIVWMYRSCARRKRSYFEHSKKEAEGKQLWDWIYQVERTIQSIAMQPASPEVLGART